MFTLIAFGTFLVAGGADSYPLSHYNHLRMPPHGTVHKGILYGFFDDDWLLPNKKRVNPHHLDGIPLEKSAKKTGRNTNSFTIRFPITFGIP
jgi:hypothetical protein